MTPQPRSEAGGAGPSHGRGRLSQRHIQFIAIGGAVGAGLFLGSGAGIAAAGPAVLVSYAICGVMIFMMARALGELALARPVADSFVVYAEEYLGRWTGFVTGWSYWLIWVLVGVAELTAAGIFLQYWVPDLPQWLSGGAALLLLYLINRANVGVFGEVEFWMTLLKVVTIIGLIVGGLAIVAYKAGDPASSIGYANLLGHGGFAPKGWSAIFTACPIAIFAFGGTEMVGLTAAEAKDPRRALPRAINGVVIRILIFYVGSLSVIMLLMPWTEAASSASPYVLAFDRIGLPWAAGLINLVVLSAVVSSCNSGIFATGRVLAALAKRGQAPRAAAGLDRRGIPAHAITASAAAMLAGVAMNYVLPGAVLAAIIALVAVLLLWTWGVIVVCQLAVRRRLGRGAFPMPFSPWSNLLVLAFLAIITVGMTLDPQSRSTVLLAGGWFLMLSIAFAIVSRRSRSASA